MYPAIIAEYSRKHILYYSSLSLPLSLSLSVSLCRCGSVQIDNNDMIVDMHSPPRPDSRIHVLVQGLRFAAALDLTMAAIVLYPMNLARA